MGDAQLPNGSLKDSIKTVHTRSRQEWREWLEKNHQSEKSVWLIIYQKRTRWRVSIPLKQLRNHFLTTKNLSKLCRGIQEKSNERGKMKNFLSE
jgi:hypothetical protein